MREKIYKILNSKFFIPSIIILFVVILVVKPRLKATISIPRNEFSVGEQIEFFLKINNISGWPILLTKPSRRYTASDYRNTIEFIIIDEKGRKYERMCHFSTGGILGGPWRHFVLPLGIVRTTAGLYPNYKSYSFQNWSYECIWPDNRSPYVNSSDTMRYLPSGRYKIRLKYFYGLRNSNISCPRILSFVGVWRGEVVSNEIDILIKPVTRKSVTEALEGIDYSDGIDEQEAIAISQQFLFDKGLEKEFNASKITIISELGTKKENSFEISFAAYMPPKRLGRIVIAVDRANGAVEEVSEGFNFVRDGDVLLRVPFYITKRDMHEDVELITNSFIPKEWTEAQVNDDRAIKTLKYIATAAESFAMDNDNKYPLASYDLTSSVSPPYINRNFCGETVSGYIYECSLASKGYTIKAVPVIPGETGTITRTITTGGVLSPPLQY